MNLLTKGILGATLAASAVVSAAPAQARPYYGHRGGDTTGAAIAGGIVGLAVGAAIGSSSRDRYYTSYPDYGYPAYPAYPVYAYPQPVYRPYPVYPRPYYYAPPPRGVVIYRGGWHGGPRGYYHGRRGW